VLFFSGCKLSTTALEGREEENVSSGTDTQDYQRNGFVISTDRKKLDLDVIHNYLSHRSYWAEGRPFSVMETAVEHSLCFGVYGDAQQVGFARVVTDYATFAWLCDVFILEGYRGMGLGKWLIECVVAYPDLQGLRLFLLATRDAHELYRSYGGFSGLQGADRWMIRDLRHDSDANDP
jgi:GNAT superfamily N-acetyltransferase